MSHRIPPELIEGGLLFRVGSGHQAALTRRGANRCPKCGALSLRGQCILELRLMVAPAEDGECTSIQVSMQCPRCDALAVAVWSGQSAEKMLTRFKALVDAAVFAEPVPAKMPVTGIPTEQADEHESVESAKPRALGGVRPSVRCPSSPPISPDEAARVISALRRARTWTGVLRALGIARD